MTEAAEPIASQSGDHEPAEGSRPRTDRHRLRDLDQRGRAIAAALFLVLMVPFVASVAGAMADDWVPSNDDALLTLRVFDVLDGEFPLLGQPSTAGLYSEAGDQPARHPGPIQYYVFAPLVAAFGSDVGMILGPALVNFAAVATAAWVVFRRAGPVIGAAAVPVIGLLAWSQGPVQLADPLSSNQGGIALLALAALAWGVADGDVRLLPGAALAFAWVAQQHLAVLGVAGGIALWCAAAAITWFVIRRRSGDANGARSVLVAVGAAVAVSVVAWLPVIIDQLFVDHNITQFIRYTGDADRETIGLRGGWHQFLHVFTVPSPILSTGHHGSYMWRSLSPVGSIAALLVMGAAVAVAVTDLRAGRRSRAHLIATVFVVAGIGAVSGSNVPLSMEANRINFYRWVFAAAVLLWVALGWWVLERLGGLRMKGASVAKHLGSGRLRLVGVAMVAVPAVAVAILASVSGRPASDSDSLLFATERRVGAELVEAVRGHDEVMLVMSGGMAHMSFGPAMAVQLEEAGHPVRVLARDGAGFGSRRVDRGEADLVVLVESASDADLSDEGLIARWDTSEGVTPEAHAALLSLIEVLESQPLVIDPTIVERMDAYGDGGYEEIVDIVVELLSAPDAQTFSNMFVLDLLERGLLIEPALDPASVELAAQSQSVRFWGDTVIQVRVLDRDPWEASRTSGAR